MIPRIKFHPRDRSLPIEMERKQFPIRLCFAVTSNKSQGQTLKHVGIYLQQDFFAHGQPYVALTRVQSPQNLKLFRPNEEKKTYQTTNVVYKEVLICHCAACKTHREKVTIAGKELWSLIRSKMIKITKGTLYHFSKCGFLLKLMIVL